MAEASSSHLVLPFHAASDCSLHHTHPRHVNSSSSVPFAVHTFSSHTKRSFPSQQQQKLVAVAMAAPHPIVRQQLWESPAEQDEQQFGRTFSSVRPPPRDGRHGVSADNKCHSSPSGGAVCFRREESTGVAALPPASVSSHTSLSCTTFNILAPIHKRINNEGCRESHFRECWLPRNQAILEMLLANESSIICLQEFWLGNEEFVKLYDNKFTSAGYQIYTLARTNNRGDGLLTAVRSERVRVLNYRELHFNDCGDRVAQIFHLQLKMPEQQGVQYREVELLLVNTHLLFPHDFSYCLIRLRQVYKILGRLEELMAELGLGSISVVLCGDWNGSKQGRVYKFLRSQGFMSSYDTAHGYTDTDTRRCISHRNHLGNMCEVDFIWLLTPGLLRKPLTSSWREAMLGTIKAKLKEVGLKGKDAFYFFQPDGSALTFDAFQQGLQQLVRHTWSYRQDSGHCIVASCLAFFCAGGGRCGGFSMDTVGSADPSLKLGLTSACLEGLTRKEVEELMQAVDVDGNGIIDFSEFKGFLDADPSMSEAAKNFPNEHLGFTAASQCLCATMEHQTEEYEGIELEREFRLQSSVDGFSIKGACLFPTEAEQGFWPDNYWLSDHAALTVTFDLPTDPVTS